MKPVPEAVTTPIQSRSEASVPVQLTIETRRGVLPSAKISAFKLIAPVYNKMHIRYYSYFFNLPYPEKPSCLQTTEASFSVQGLWQTEPYLP